MGAIIGFLVLGVPCAAFLLWFLTLPANGG